MTGLAQVSGRRNISFDERRKLDLYYVQNWSLLGRPGNPGQNHLDSSVS